MKCSKIAVYRFTWPGQDESYICEEHEPQLKGIANAMGFHCQTIDYMGHEECRQQMKEK